MCFMLQAYAWDRTDFCLYFSHSLIEYLFSSLIGLKKRRECMLSPTIVHALTLNGDCSSRLILVGRNRMLHTAE
jgi:hypothetical protein